MDTQLAGRIQTQRERRATVRLVVVGAMVALLFMTATMTGPYRVRVAVVPVARQPVTKSQPMAKAAAIIAHAAAAAHTAVSHAVVQAAPRVPLKIPRVRMTVAEALMRGPATSLSLLPLLILAAVTCVPLSRRVSPAGGDGQRLPRGQRRALLQVFLI